MMAVLASIILMASASPTTTPDEERLIAETIGALRDYLPRRADVRFRDVHIRRAVNVSGGRTNLVCGRIDVDGPEGAAGWEAIVSMNFMRINFFIGRNVLVDAEAACAPHMPGWDYGRDFAPRFQAEVNAGRRRSR